MSESSSLVIGCATTVSGDLMTLRNSILQMKAQSTRPQHHAIYSYGKPSLDLRLVSDLLDPSITFRHSATAHTPAEAANESLKMLRDRRTDLYFWIEAEHLYRSDYIGAIVREIESAKIDLATEHFCSVLVHQEYITLAENGEAFSRPQSFLAHTNEASTNGGGAGATFVFNRKTVDLLIAVAANHPADGTVESTWRQLLKEAGIEIRHIRTKKPVFGHIERRTPKTGSSDPSNKRVARRRQPSGAPEISVIIPTFNEGDWLQRTVESILDADTKSSFEIVVVDDGCTDGSIAAIQGVPDVRIIRTPKPPSGLIVAKNAGARVARGKYFCFVDSHVLVFDHWLDQLLQTCVAHPGESLVSGLVLDVANPFDAKAPRHLFGYCLRDWTLTTRWHHYGIAKDDRPYPAPLCPGGLMFCRRSHFVRLGGFCPVLRQWGHEDVEISLRNYSFGGENIVDPRVVVRHYYKNNTDKKPAFRADFRNTSFNALFVAKNYFPPEHFGHVRDALAAKGNIDAVIAEIEAGAGDEVMADYRSEFIPGFDGWTSAFQAELSFMQNGEIHSIARQDGISER